MWVSQPQVNDCVSWGWLEKTGGPKIWYAYAEPGEADVPPAETMRKRGDDLFLGVYSETWWGKTDSWTQAAKMWGGETLWSPFFGGGFQKNPYPGRNPVDEHVRNTTENQEENSRSMSSLSFSLWYVASLWPANAVVSVSILSFFLPVTTYNLGRK